MPLEPADLIGFGPLDEAQGQERGVLPAVETDDGPPVAPEEGPSPPQSSDPATLVRIAGVEAQVVLDPHENGLEAVDAQAGPALERANGVAVLGLQERC